MAIHAIVVMNTTGAARLTKFYVPLPPAAQQAFVRDAHVLIARRPEGVCNIIASVASADAVGDGAGGGGGGSGDWARCFPGGGGGIGSGGAAASAAAPSSEGVRLIYRQYATLFFVAAVDETESALGIMDLLQVLVETLDQCFENVCELDLIFHMDKVRLARCLAGCAVLRGGGGGPVGGAWLHRVTRRLGTVY